MGAWRPKHVECLCRNKTCTVLHQFGVFICPILRCTETQSKIKKKKVHYRIHKSHVNPFHAPQPPLLLHQFFHAYAFQSAPLPFRFSSVGIATSYGLDGLGIESQLKRDFRTRPDWPSGPLSLLYNGYRVISGVNQPGRGADRPSHLTPRLKKEKSYISTTAQGHRGLFQGELYLLSHQNSKCTSLPYVPHAPPISFSFIWSPE